MKIDTASGRGAKEDDCHDTSGMTHVRNKTDPPPNQKTDREFDTTMFRSNPPWGHIKSRELTDPVCN